MGPLLPAVWHIFDSAGSPVLDLDKLADYCRSLLPATEVVVHGDFFAYCLKELKEIDALEVKDSIAARIAAARVIDPNIPAGTGRPIQSAVAYERKMLDRDLPRPVGVFYDGFDLCLALRALWCFSGRPADDRVVVFTNQLFGTMEEYENRYHARVSIYGHPCLISTTGLVQAPARPREEYVWRSPGGSAARARSGEERFLTADDPRTSEVLKRYLAQAVFYCSTGEPFCADRTCRLYNAHWQEELLDTQTGGDFCENHHNLLRQMQMGA